MSPGTAAHGGSSGSSYTGRFAPSPSGPLHAGSMVAALASWLDARAHGGRWLVRIEDVDTPRCVPGADAEILRQLAACSLHPDAPPLYQSSRDAAYARALEQLAARELAYPCACTRKDIEAAHAAQGLVHARHAERPYPGTCRAGLHGRAARAWRLHVPRAAQAAGLPGPPAPTWLAGDVLHWTDRRLRGQQQDVAGTVGDFVLRRADGLWAYQLAVVVDDAEQGITDVVRGEDLADNTPRQILLQRALGAATPRYLHTPLVRDDQGDKLSKQNGAPAVPTDDPLRTLSQAATALGLPAVQHPHHTTVAQALGEWVNQWRRNYNGMETCCP